MAFLSQLWLMLAEPSKGIAERSKDIAERSKGIAEHSKDIAETSKDIAELSKDLAETSKGVAERSKGLFNKLCQKGSVFHPPTTHSPTLYIQDNRVVMLPISILRPTL